MTGRETPWTRTGNAQRRGASAGKTGRAGPTRGGRGWSRPREPTRVGTDGWKERRAPSSRGRQAAPRRSQRGKQEELGKVTGRAVCRTVSFRPTTRKVRGREVRRLTGRSKTRGAPSTGSLRTRTAAANTENTPDAAPAPGPSPAPATPPAPPPPAHRGLLGLPRRPVCSPRSDGPGAPRLGPHPGRVPAAPPAHAAAQRYRLGPAPTLQGHRVPTPSL